MSGQLIPVKRLSGDRFGVSWTSPIKRFEFTHIGFTSAVMSDGQ